MGKQAKVPLPSLGTITDAETQRVATRVLIAAGSDLVYER